MKRLSAVPIGSVTSKPSIGGSGRVGPEVVRREGPAIGALFASGQVVWQPDIGSRSHTPSCEHG